MSTELHKVSLIILAAQHGLQKKNSQALNKFRHENIKNTIGKTQGLADN